MFVVTATLKVDVSSGPLVPVVWEIKALSKCLQLKKFTFNFNFFRGTYYLERPQSITVALQTLLRRLPSSVTDVIIKMYMEGTLTVVEHLIGVLHWREVFAALPFQKAGHTITFVGMSNWTFFEDQIEGIWSANKCHVIGTCIHSIYDFYAHLNIDGTSMKVKLMSKDQSI